MGLSVYLASSLKNVVLNAQLCRELQANGFDCFLPQEDTDQNSTPENIAFENRSALLAADLVVVVGENMGRDTSWESGLASGNQKPMIFVQQSTDEYAGDYMVNHGGEFAGLIETTGRSPEQIARDICDLAKRVEITAGPLNFNENALSYSLDWFKHHADQRYKSFQLFVLQLFLAPLAILVSSTAKDGLTAEPAYWAILSLAFGLSFWLSLLFYRLDLRNRRLVRIGEAALIQIEESLFKGGEGILLKDRADPDGAGRMLYSHSQLLHAIFMTSMAVSLLISAYSAYAFISKLSEPQSEPESEPIQIEIVN